ncbi:FecR domain-containing protein [Sphingobacterium sp.]|uniref:FecR family protein n=1 Tax=Sphingobacterium sp. TaxID=341027 RepID=UPI0031D877CE
MEEKTKAWLLILKRIEEGTASAEDLQQYNRWCDSMQAEQAMEHPVHMDPVLKDRMLEDITQKTFPRKRAVLRRIPVLASVAASLFCVVATALWFYQKDNLNPKTTELVGQVNPPAISDGAVLILDNGEQINLEKQGNGQIDLNANSKVSKNSDSSLVYNANGNANSSSPLFNTLMTARGHQYQLTLADGTKVWLNASSSLRFPVSFSGQKERRVLLEGEGYFEVAKNPALPFIVVTDKQEIKVLGTHFNVKSDKGAASSATTLLEGSVLVNNAIKLLPGEQLLASSTGVSKRKVNVEDAIAWKNGYFNFDGRQITEIMDELSRWYDLDIRYKGSIPKDKVDATISRRKSVDEVFELLELTGLATFSRNGRTITVTQTK